jgi:hypothetical protein
MIVWLEQREYLYIPQLHQWVYTLDHRVSLVDSPCPFLPMNQHISLQNEWYAPCISANSDSPLGVAAQADEDDEEEQLRQLQAELAM